MTRKAWRLVAAAYVILALGFIAVTVWLSRQQDDLQKHQNALIAEAKRIEVNEKALKRNQAVVFRLTADTAATICLVALAKEPQEVALVKEFVRGKKIDISKSPICEKAVREAARLILVEKR